MNEDSTALWEALHEIRDRVTRIEERSTNRDEKISDMAGKVGEMHTFFVQTQGGLKTATAMTKYAYGIGGVIFTFIVTNWEWLKRLLRVS